VPTHRHVRVRDVRRHLVARAARDSEACIARERSRGERVAVMELVAAEQHLRLGGKHACW
jgi:hypothetical protein